MSDDPQFADRPKLAPAAASSGVALLLLIFLGGFGAHRFYLARPALSLCQNDVPTAHDDLAALIEIFGNEDRRFRRCRRDHSHHRR